MSRLLRDTLFKAAVNCLDNRKRQLFIAYAGKSRMEHRFIILQVDHWMNILHGEVSISKTRIFGYSLFVLILQFTLKQEFNSLPYSSCFRAAQRHTRPELPAARGRQRIPWARDPSASVDSAAPSLTHHILVWQPTCSQSSPSLHEACGGLFLRGTCTETRAETSCTYGCRHSSETVFCTGVHHGTRWERCILTAGLKLLSDVFYSLWTLPRPGKLYPLGNTGSNFPKLNPPQTQLK